MELMRFDPWLKPRRLDYWRRFFSDDWMEPSFREPEGWSSDCFVPPVDIRETEESYVLEAEIPGVTKEDVKIDVKDGVLNMTGERHYGSEDNRENYTRVERCYGAFHRHFTLPDHVDIEKIDAHYKDGILTVSLPKGEKAKPKLIDVKIQ